MNQVQWTPNQEHLEKLAQLLHQSQSGNNEVQKQIYEQLEQLYKNPEFPCYLAYILEKMDKQYNSLRQRAGIVLKGVLEQIAKDLPQQNLNFVKQTLLNCFNDETEFIRKAVSIASTGLFCKIGYQNWPELLQTIAGLLMKDSEDAVTTGLDCLDKILEDLVIDKENQKWIDNPNQVLGEMIPALIKLCNPQLTTKIKTIALSCLNRFASFMPVEMVVNSNDYLKALAANYADQQAQVREQVARGFSELLVHRKDLIQQNLHDIVQVMMKLTFDQEPDVSQAAIFFWNEFMLLEVDETMDRINTIKPYFSDLIPRLIVCYSNCFQLTF